MKKFLFICLTIFSLSALDVLASCPNGFSPKNVRLEIDNCFFDVILCYKCGSTTEPAQVNVFSFSRVDTTPSCSTTLSFNEILSQIYNQMYTIDELTTLCDSIPGPCETNKDLYFTCLYEICWQKRYIDSRIWISTCNLENCYCREVYKICYDENLVPPRFVMTLVYGPEASCPGYNPPINKCPAQEVNIPDPTSENPLSDCFFYTTPCNP